MTKGILVINAGSTSVKFAGYRHDSGEELQSRRPRPDRGNRQPAPFHRQGRRRQADRCPEWEVDDPLTQDGGSSLHLWLAEGPPPGNYICRGRTPAGPGRRQARPACAHRRSDPRGTQFLMQGRAVTSALRDCRHTGYRQGRAKHTASGLLRFVIPPDDAGNRSALRAASICD